MTRWSPGAALRLEEAAMSLFAEQGYAVTTVPQITERAGLTTRTFFRHFADKRDVLFLRDREFPSVVGSVLDGLPPELTGVDLLRAGLGRTAEELEQWREQIARRQAVISGEEQLRERELLKLDHLADVIRATLVSRGTADRQAETLARLSSVVFDTALRRWIAAAPGPSLSTPATTLATEVDAAWTDLTTLFAPAPAP